MKFEKNELGPYQLRALEHWKAYLESNSEKIKESFGKVIHTFKLQAKSGLIASFFDSFSKDKNEVRKIEFWHEAWEFNFETEFLDGKENVVKHELSKMQLFGIYEDYTEPLEYNFIYPQDCDVYLEDHREMLFSTQKFQHFFTWFVKNWIECGGHRINVLTTTEENSVRRVFNLNYCRWSDSIGLIDPTPTLIVKYPINRELTEIELESRVNMEDRGLFCTRWMFLEKGSEFAEYGIYHFDLYKRKGSKQEFLIEPFESGKLDIISFWKEIDDMLNDGWTEVIRPLNGPPIHKDYVEWNFLGYRNKKEVSINSLDELEETIGYKLPGQYRWFIKKMNGQENINGMSLFRVAFGSWQRITTFVRIEDFVDELISLNTKNKLDSNTFTMAHCENDQKIIMNAATDKISLLKPSGEILALYSNLQELLGNCVANFQYLGSARVHIEKSNYKMLKHLFDKGLQIEDIKTRGKRSVLQISNDVKINRLLLENGADPNSVYIYPDVSLEFLKLLLEYGFNLKQKISDFPEIEKYLNRRTETRLILQEYESKTYKG